ncbi:hypothetical protein [Actinocrispum sp. NPDC049592]|uniref:hypothetical protein n=1 Tax=Actinocrispum sp. NPDC049592 TaxID=3154835 RepID=UPI0034438DBB
MTNRVWVPESVVGDGRFRLLELTGVDERDNAQLWRARDGRSRRDVALTIVSGEGTEGGRRGLHALKRSVHRSALRHPGVAPVLDVVGGGADEGIGGIVVAEWTRGTAMSDVVARYPVDPVHACWLLDPLTEAVSKAHRHGVVLGVGHPLRIRVSPAGTLRLAFPGPPREADLADDVRGLGAILYFLLTGTWPAEDGPLPTPRELEPAVPVELSEVAMRSLVDTRDGGVRTSDTILRVLREVRQKPLAVSETREPDSNGAVWLTKPPVTDPERRKKLAIAVAVLVLLAIGVVLWIGLTVIGVFL